MLSTDKTSLMCVTFLGQNTKVISVCVLTLYLRMQDKITKIFSLTNHSSFKSLIMVPRIKTSANRKLKVVRFTARILTADGLDLSLSDFMNPLLLNFPNQGIEPVSFFPTIFCGSSQVSSITLVCDRMKHISKFQ